jgi:hypothetical protein
MLYNTVLASDTEDAAAAEAMRDGLEDAIDFSSDKVRYCENSLPYPNFTYL